MPRTVLDPRDTRRKQKKKILSLEVYLYTKEKEKYNKNIKWVVVKIGS